MSIYEGNMDKPVSSKTKRARKIKTISIVGGVLLLSSGAIFTLQRMVTPTFNANEIKIGVVTRGDVYESITASGVIESATENIILSPATAQLKRIVRGAGSYVEKGDTILLLDSESLKKAYEKSENQLKLKENSLWQYKLNTKKQKLELVHSKRVKQLRITELETQLSEEDQLFKVGGVSKERIRKTKQELLLAQQELELLDKKNSIELEKLSASRQALEVEISMVRASLAESRKTLSQACITAPISGIIVEIAGKEGEMISSGRMLSKVSDLKRFKLMGTISDSNADKINTGGRVLAIKDDNQLEGVIGNVRPLVDNNQIKFDVYLKQSNHPDLRPNQKMELRVVVAEHKNVLRLPDGMFFDGTKNLDVFIVNGDKAIRKEVKVGLSNFDFIEVEDGLQEGDQVVISNVKEYKNMSEVVIKKK